MKLESLSDTIIEFFSRVYERITTGISAYPRQIWETNEEWSKRLKEHCTRCILSSARDHNGSLKFIDMPYNSEVVGKGLGVNVLEDMVVTDDIMDHHSHCLVDIVDGTWAAVSGFPYSGSTTLTISSKSDKKKEELTLNDFIYAAVIPHCGDGWYFGSRGSHTRRMGQNINIVRLTQKTNPKEIRFILDLFTTENYDQLERSLYAVRPIILEWADFVRIYGAGIEITTLFGYEKIEPSVGAYVSANQKMDNVIPLAILMEGAGGKVCDWWGNSLGNMKLEDRAYVVMSANGTLHRNLLEHLQNSPMIT